ncbi:uncharacterized protein B0I36DRAFT_426270 [Microdochium trichocladiopsis]|uniref:Zn(2)-C6 fungal-type domain-containing protein n=1 Tax=Microdochium trichocladiopsis TaxID=1682393 RepID=A0A9P9BZ08_9PEZI|nr:uncharacterized protein B0I36DRAFT_426270 [Microdochium trichocladiopsis]KAH7039614.1 hypothetical protein B0I36DRAFT_426270 [Microdochium trichocladiopsis]
MSSGIELQACPSSQDDRGCLVGLLEHHINTAPPTYIVRNLNNQSSPLAVELFHLPRPPLHSIRPAGQNCRERKVKCNGNHSGCQQCAHLNLRCIYKTSDAASKSRAKAGRGSVISRLKRHGVRENAVPEVSRGCGLRIAPVSSSNGTGSIPLSSPPEKPLPGAGAGSAMMMALESEFDQAFFSALVQPYDDYIYCVSPVVTASEVRAAIGAMHDDPFDFLLVHAFGAATLNLTQPDWRADPREAAKLKRLMDIAVYARSQLSAPCFSSIQQQQKQQAAGSGGGSGCGSGVRPLLAESFIMSNIFLEICFMAFQRHEEAFLMLREAVSLIQVLRIDSRTRARSLQERTAAAGGGAQTDESRRQRAAEAKRERLYWLVFIHERFMAIIEYYPIVLEPLQGSVAVDDETLPVQIREGFQSLIQMFCVIDHDFVSHWRGVSPTLSSSSSSSTAALASSSSPSLPSGSAVTREWIEAKKSQLDSLDFMLQPRPAASSSSPYSLGNIIHPTDDLFAATTAATSESSPSANLATENWATLSTLQQADLVVTRQWMLTLLWQLALSHCVLTSSSSSSASAGADGHGHGYNHEGVPGSSPQATSGTSTTTTAPEATPMSLSFPVRLSQQLRAVILQLGRQYVERHGTGIIQKLFEITTTFADVIVHVPVPHLLSSSSPVPVSVSSPGTAVGAAAVAGGEDRARKEEQQQQEQEQQQHQERERRQRFDDFEFLHNFLRDFAGLDEVQGRILADKAALVRAVQRSG